MFDRRPRQATPIHNAPAVRKAALPSKASAAARRPTGVPLDVNDLVEHVSMLMLRDPRLVYRPKA